MAELSDICIQSQGFSDIKNNLVSRKDNYKFLNIFLNHVFYINNIYIYIKHNYLIIITQY